MQTIIPPPRLETILGPLLASLPAAAASPQPPTALLPLLSPILRQRVQLLSSADTEPWLPLLCYDSSKASKLQKIVRNERLEAHPVSGEVEVDWDSEVELRYKRIDDETLQALASIPDLSLRTRLVWCVNDEIGGGDGWRIGEVCVLEANTDSSWVTSITSAESSFRAPATYLPVPSKTNGNALHMPDEDDDDDYWNQYDKTPAHTPAPQQSPAPPLTHAADEDSYYAQYATVQPAMDNHDPDEAQQNGAVESSLGRDEITRELLLSSHDQELSSTSAAWPSIPPETDGSDPSYGQIPFGNEMLAQPRPGSSTGSSGSDTVARLERRAAAREHSEVGIKQYISSSVKSLYRLAKGQGIERAEFERLVKTELDCLGLMDEDDA